MTTTLEPLSVLELFSGVGGMHFALEEALKQLEDGTTARVAAAVDISEVANQVYRHNFPPTVHHSSNICGLTAAKLRPLRPRMLLMSPPCQPFTRQGLQKDLSDPRTQPLTHILTLIPQLHELDYILLENVKGFETSQARAQVIETLDRCSFHWQEFLISPSQLGIPNSRLRYYLLAKKSTKFAFQTQNEIWTSLDELLSQNSGVGKEAAAASNTTTRILKDFLEDDVDFEEYRLSPKLLLKRAEVLDIVRPEDDHSCCFTKSYGRYAEGTGSILQQSGNLDDVYSRLREIPEENADEKLSVLGELKLRHFTPREISRLMGFPENFRFPETSTKIQRYRVLGNSLNVAVVAFLLKLLLIK